MAYDLNDFQTDVLARSRTTPVLVDFWAPWCGPCRVLGPTLEKLAGEANGAWELVKINSDQHPDLAQRYGVRGIPAVKLFAGGEVVDEFTGALPEYAIKQWLDKALPNEHRAQVDRAQALLEAGDMDAARTLLETTLNGDPTNAKAQLLLAQTLVFDDPPRAAELAEGAAFAGPGFVQLGEAVQTVAGLLQRAHSGEPLPEGPAADTFRAALDALAQRDFDAALDRFIDVITRDRYYLDDAARKACVALFTLLGPQHDATRAFRRRFDMSLY